MYVRNGIRSSLVSVRLATRTSWVDKEVPITADNTNLDRLRWSRERGGITGTFINCILIIK